MIFSEINFAALLMGGFYGMDTYDRFIFNLKIL